MAFKINRTAKYFFPSINIVNDSLRNFDLSDETIISLIENFVCNDKLHTGFGYQQSIAASLEYELKKNLIEKFNLMEAPLSYSDNINYDADIALQKTTDGKKIYFEIEFRPNVEKDLIKFQIGLNSGTLEVAVLIVAINRNSINTRYSTMIEYDKVKLILENIKPNYSILLIGIDGEHAD